MPVVAEMLAAETVTVVLPEITPAASVAVITAVPGPLGVNAPPTPGVMTELSLDVHVALALRFVVVPSEFVPVAVNVSPAALIGMGGRFPGVIAMLCRTGVPTESVAGGDVMEPEDAVI